MGRGRPNAGGRRRGPLAARDLAQRLFEEFRIVIGSTALGRTLRKMGYRAWRGNQRRRLG